MIEFIGRRHRQTVQSKADVTLLSIALEQKVDWGFSCVNGICARCRCFVQAGREWITDPTKAELARLEPEEIAEGYRLACQTKVNGDVGLSDSDSIVVVHKPYF